MTVGRGSYTAFKHANVDPVVRAYLPTAKQIVLKSPWAARRILLGDCNGGDGGNGTCTASILLDAAHRNNTLPYTLIAMEREARDAMLLRKVLADRDSDGVDWTVITGDNRDLVTHLRSAAGSDRLLHNSFGLVIADPNGIKELPVHALREVAIHAPHIDLLVCVQANAANRVWGYVRKRERWGDLNRDQWQEVTKWFERLQGLPKQHVLTRYVGGKWQLTLVFMSNYVSRSLRTWLGQYGYREPGRWEQGLLPW